MGTRQGRGGERNGAPSPRRGAGTAGDSGSTREWLAFALSAARDAGDILARGFATIERGEVDYKGWRDLVTRFDLASEKLIVERIHDVWPAHAILAEEGGARDGSSPYRWIIDPLDGTTNFVHRHPFFCVSIGLADEEGLLVGVVHAPRLRETFAAVRGGGAFRGGRRLRVSDEADLGHALLASGFAYRHGEGGNSNLENWARLSLETRGLRRCGSAALDLAYVADARYDGYWELALSPWDVAAGALLVREAGGRVTDARGGETWLHGGSIVASNGALHDAVLARISAE